ncbi:MAG: hypothetical protein HYS18_05715 [Burkholderiales bacterium]|nr:hypothetical protein [Burkholderiales bacterium]
MVIPATQAVRSVAQPISKTPAPAQEETSLEAREQDLRRIREEIQQQHEQDLEKVRAEVEKARADAESRGYDQGLLLGKESAKQAFAEQTQRLASIAASLSEARTGAIDGAEDLLVEIVFAAVCQIIGDTATTREGVMSLVSQMVAGFKDHDNLTVRLHPDDWDLIQKMLANSDDVRIDPKVILRADTSVNSGGCIVDTSTGSLDARLDVQLERLRETLMYVRRHKDVTEDGQ